MRSVFTLYRGVWCAPIEDELGGAEGKTEKAFVRFLSLCFLTDDIYEHLNIVQIVVMRAGTEIPEEVFLCAKKAIDFLCRHGGLP